MTDTTQVNKEIDTSEGENVDSELTVSSSVPEAYRTIFKYERFNEMQSILLNQALMSDLNMVVAAPTGSGKTVVHELAIIRLLEYRKNQEIKCVFIAPNKALCQQRAAEWTNSFGKLGLMVLEITGDSPLETSLKSVAIASIIITTPEKWDSITRIWRNHVFLLGRIDLLLIDEVHHINEDRGATLEIVIVRMRTLSDAYRSRVQVYNDQSTLNVEKKIRIIALSATLPNVADIGKWLHCGPESIHYFDASFRPVPLTQHLIAYSTMSNAFLFERSLDNHVKEVIKKYSSSKQTLIFCSSKKGTENLATNLSTSLELPRYNFTPETTAALLTIQEPTLKNLCFKRTAYHHAGLPADDRNMVEMLFLQGHIIILCTTSTLAHGVNLPAHLVIVKGTSQWRGGGKGYERIPRSLLLQMIGRAGRPGFDKEGVAVVMTSDADKSYYQDLTVSSEIVESSLQGILIEAICAEITQTVIRDVSEAIEWLQNTFFFVRVHKNPARYGFTDVKDAAHLNALLQTFCMNAIQELAAAGIVAFDSYIVEPLPEAHHMTRNMIKFKTMVLLTKLPINCQIKELLENVCTAEETHKPVRRNEKKILNDLSKSLRFPYKGRVQESFQKAYVLLQTAVGRIHISDFTLRFEQAEMVDQCLRVISTLIEYSREREKGQLLESAVLLQRALRMRMWEVAGSCSIFVQCPGISEQTKTKLQDHKLLTISDLERVSPLRISDLLKCSDAEARQLALFVKFCHQSMLSVHASSSNGMLNIDICPINESSVSNNSPFNTVIYILLSIHIPTSVLLCYRRIASGVGVYNYTVPLPLHYDLSDIRTSIISSLSGLDYIHAPSKTQENPPVTNNRNISSSQHVERLNSTTTSASKKKACGKQNSKQRKATVSEKSSNVQRDNQTENLAPVKSKNIFDLFNYQSSRNVIPSQPSGANENETDLSDPFYTTPDTTENDNHQIFDDEKDNYKSRQRIDQLWRNSDCNYLDENHDDSSYLDHDGDGGATPSTTIRERNLDDQLPATAAKHEIEYMPRPSTSSSRIETNAINATSQQQRNPSNKISKVYSNSFPHPIKGSTITNKNIFSQELTPDKQTSNDFDRRNSTKIKSTVNHDLLMLRNKALELGMGIPRKLPRVSSSVSPNNNIRLSQADSLTPSDQHPSAYISTKPHMQRRQDEYFTSPENANGEDDTDYHASYTNATSGPTRHITADFEDECHTQTNYSNNDREQDSPDTHHMKSFPTASQCDHNLYPTEFPISFSPDLDKRQTFKRHKQEEGYSGRNREGLFTNDFSDADQHPRHYDERGSRQLAHSFFDTTATTKNRSMMKPPSIKGGSSTIYDNNSNNVFNTPSYNAPPPAAGAHPSRLLQNNPQHNSKTLFATPTKDQHDENLEPDDSRQQSAPQYSQQSRTGGDRGPSTSTMGVTVKRGIHHDGNLRRGESPFISNCPPVASSNEVTEVDAIHHNMTDIGNCSKNGFEDINSNNNSTFSSSNHNTNTIKKVGLGHSSQNYLNTNNHMKRDCDVRNGGHYQSNNTYQKTEQIIPHNNNNIKILNKITKKDDNYESNKPHAHRQHPYGHHHEEVDAEDDEEGNGRSFLTNSRRPLSQDFEKEPIEDLFERGFL